jgi:hypothetical protein
MISHKYILKNGYTKILVQAFNRNPKLLIEAKKKEITNTATKKFLDFIFWKLIKDGAIKKEPRVKENKDNPCRG